jgi:hypothetical protein
MQGLASSLDYLRCLYAPGKQVRIVSPCFHSSELALPVLFTWYLPWERWIAGCLSGLIPGKIRELPKMLPGEPLIAAVADHF